LHTGKKAAKAKVAIEYEQNVPRCDTCKHYRQAKTLLFNSLPHWLPNRCLQHNIRVDPMGLCRTWESKSGEVLML
jgi:Zn finger protein HypA/HybF involved in hydrogenase expression